MPKKILTTVQLILVFTKKALDLSKTHLSDLQLKQHPRSCGVTKDQHSDIDILTFA